MEVRARQHSSSSIVEPDDGWPRDVASPGWISPVRPPPPPLFGIPGKESSILVVAVNNSILDSASSIDHERIKTRTQDKVSSGIYDRADSSFRAAPNSIRPLYTGGPVALTRDGAWLITTMGEEVLVTEVASGRGVARVKGVSPSFRKTKEEERELTAGHDGHYGPRSELPHLPADAHHGPRLLERAVLPPSLFSPGRQAAPPTIHQGPVSRGGRANPPRCRVPGLYPPRDGKF